MKRLASALAALAFAGAAAANEGGLPYHFEPSGNAASLQRGARNFMGYCSGCHSMKHLRYNRLARDLSLSEDQVRSNLMFTSDKFGDHIMSSMPKDSASWFGQAPPDLSLETRFRGADWVYNYLLTFYVDPARPMGVNNLVLPNASMPHVLWELQGWQVKPAVAAEDAHASSGEEHGEHGAGLELAVPGKLSPEEYRGFVSDTVSFMAYAAEPGRAMRTRVGAKVILYLLVLTVLAYFMKVEWWRDVH
jgi:ubiquinol-cytochrome c reductase cytochrome c1 subunit